MSDTCDTHILIIRAKEVHMFLFFVFINARKRKKRTKTFIETNLMIFDVFWALVDMIL